MLEPDPERFCGIPKHRMWNQWDRSLGWSIWVTVEVQTCRRIIEEGINILFSRSPDQPLEIFMKVTKVNGQNLC